MFDIDFNRSDLQVIVHPQYQALIPKILEGLKPYNLENHFVLLSSGTTGGDIKGYAISKGALFSNAKTTNEHFKLNEKDVWGLSLPVYHVGGLSVLARAHLLKNKVVDLRKWNTASWMQEMKDVTITTIVPTQLYDLVKQNFEAPTSLRYLVVGGDFLSSTLKAEALKLGWPVIRTFGMSEVSSQLASTNKPESDDLQVLPIHKIKISDDRQLLVKSDSLFTLRFGLGKEFKVNLLKDLCDEEGYFMTSDQAEVSGNILRHLGRMGDEIKISGHLVNMKDLKETVGQFLVEKDLFGKVEFILEDDERKVKKLVLLIQKDAVEKFSIGELSSILMPIKVDEYRIVPTLGRTALGKLKIKE